MILNEPEGRLESPWEVAIRKTRNGYTVSWYIELNASREPLYRLQETNCKTIEEAYSVVAEYLGEFSTHAVRNNELDDE